MCVNCRSIKRFLCIIACKDQNAAFCQVDEQLTAMEKRRPQMHRDNYYHKKDAAGSDMIDLLVRLLVTLCVGGVLFWLAIYSILLFADAIDGHEYRQNGEHLKNLMHTEQSNLNAAKQLNGGGN